MAKRIEIDLELKSKIDSSRQIFNTLKEKDAFKNSPRASKTFESIIKELDSLSQVSEPTLKQLSRMNSLFNQMSDILVNAANSVNESSAEFKKIQETIDEIGGKLETSRKSKGKILKQGRINETTGNYELFDTYQTEQLQLANIIGSNGKQIKSIGTFRKKFDANGQAIAGAFQDPVAAQALYDKLKKHQEDNAINLAKLNEEIANYTTQLTEAKNKLTEQAGKEKSPIAGQVIENKLNFNQILEDKKTLLHTQKDLQKTTSRVEGLNNSLAKQSSALGNVFKQFTLYHLGLKFVKKALREAVQTIKELDQSLTEQAMVTGMTREQAYGLIKDYQDLALQVGATTKEIAGVATEYMKQGKTIEDSLKLTEAAVAAAKVALVSVGDSVNY